MIGCWVFGIRCWVFGIRSTTKQLPTAYRPYGCGEFYDQNGKPPGYLNTNGKGIGSEQQVQVALARGRESGRHPSAGGN